jgi:hypothetical protein
MIVNVAFLTTILSVVSSAVLGQSSSTLEINKDYISPSGQDVCNLATPKSGNLFRSFVRSLLLATGSGQKSRRCKRLRRKKENRTNEERLAPVLEG